MKPKKKQKIYAFIDSQNLNLGVRSQGWILDFKKFYQYLKSKYQVHKVLFFIGYVKENQKLYDFLRNVGYELVFKPTFIHADGKIKGNVDAELVLHAMMELEYYDKAIIVTGDGDFYCLVEFLYKIFKLDKIIVPNSRSYSSLLRDFISDIIFMDDLREKLGYKKIERHYRKHS